MPWPPRQPARSEMKDDAELRAYEEVIARARKMGISNPEVETPYYGQLLHSPLFSAALNKMGELSRAVGERNDSYSHADREWVDQVLAVELNTELVQGRHLADALAVGVRLEAIEALRAGREEELTPEEQLLTSFIRKVLHGQMDADTWNAVEKRIGERGVVDYAIFVLYLHFTMRLIRTLSDGTPPTKEEIDQKIQDYKTGKLKLPVFNKAENV